MIREACSTVTILAGAEATAGRVALIEAVERPGSEPHTIRSGRLLLVEGTVQRRE